VIMAKPKGTRTSNIHTVSTPALQSVHFGRHSFDPRFDARTKEQKRIDDTIAQYEQKSSPLAPQVSLVDYEGYPFVTSMADRNAAGRILTSIDDVQLYRPVEQQGGQDYMFFNPGQVWASGRAPVSGIMTAAQIMREATGKNPLYLPWRMSPTGGDFGAIAGEAMLSHAESSLGSGLKRKIDRDIKKFIPNWKGIDSPESYDQFRAAPDKMRKALMHMMDKEYRDQGTLNYGQARLSATDPNQFNAPQLEIQNVGQIWADKPVIQKSGHSYYPFGVPGEGLGVIERPHNIYELLPQVAKDRGVIDPKNPSHDDRRSMESNIRAGIIDDKLLKSLGYAAGGLVDSAPEEAIKNTIKDPQAFRMLDMDLANLALMSQQPPRRMAGGGKMNKDEDLFALKPQPKPAVPTVRELVAEIGKSPSRYEAKYPAKDFTPLELQAYRLMQAAKATPDANRYLESLNPYFDSQLKFDIGAGNDAGYVEPKVPNLAVVQQLQDIKNTIPHELTHTLQLGKGKGTELERDRQVMQRAKALPIETQKTMMPSGNRYENMKETWANINARAHEVNAAGGDFINSPEGRALFPTPEMQREYYTRSMPGVNSLTPSTGTFVANTSAPVDRSKQSYAQQALRALGFAEGGIIHMAGGGRPPLRSLDEVPSDEYLKAEIARINAAPTVRANSADETANYARYVAERAGQPIEMPARPDYTPGFSVLEKPTYGSEVPGTTPTVDQQRYELTMRGQQEAANKRYRAQQGDALAGMDPTGTLAVTDAARTMGLGMLALPVHAGRTAFHYLQHGNMKDAPTGKDYEELMSPRTAEGAELVEEVGTIGSRLTGSEMGFGMNPTLWAHTPPTVAQMRAGLKLGAERAAPVIKDIGAMANERYLTGQMPGMVAPASPVTTWHGTPHNIEGNKFDNSKIGTGEGNQSYGYGHYSAGSKGVGENYRDTLSVDPNQASENIKESTLKKFLPNESPNVQEQINGFLSGLGYYDDFKVTIMREGSDAFKAALLKEEPLLFSGGNLYKIDIPDPVVEKMLDWDKPLKDQSPHVQKALAKIAPDLYSPNSPDYDPSETGGMIYQRVVSIANSKVSPEWIKKRDLLMKKVQVEGDSAMPELTAHLDTFPRPDKLGSEMLLKNGITGNKYLDGGSRGVGSGTHNFVVFDPKYAKFLEKNGEAIEQPKATSAKPEKALAPANEQGFYSPTEAAALNLQRQSGNGQAFLNDLMKGENVSSEEISGMGLDTFLKGRTSVTAAEVQDYIAQNKLQLGEARYGALTKDISKSRDAFKAYGQELASKYGIPEGQNISMYAGLKNIPAEEIAKYERLQNEWLDQQPKAAKFPKWQLPGGKNYREVVITLPTEGRGLSEIELDKINRRLVDQGYDGLGEEQRAVAMRGGNEAMDMLQDLEDRVGIRTDDLMKAMAGGDPRTQYRSSHWDEPNVLAHLRMSDRVTDGKKTLLVDEVQSDWHQAARDARTAEIKRLIDTYGVSKKDAQKAVPKDFGYKLSPEVTAKMDSEYRALVHKNADAVTQGLTPDPNDVARAKMLENQLMQSDSSRIPDAPYKDDYYQLALKRAIKEAIDGGYDRVALPTGARVNERFSLTKHINEVHYSGSNLKAYDHNGKEVISETGVRPEDLPTYVGKETANKLLEQPKQGTLRSLIGQDLEVGGEGNKKYYDEIYPTYLKNFGKKYGASVGTTYAKTDIQEWPFPIQIESDGKNFWLFGQDPRIDKKAKLSSNFSSYEDANKFRDSMYEGNTEPLHYMDITPAMRKEFSTGIHMKRGGKVSFASNVDAMRHELTQRQ